MPLRRSARHTERRLPAPYDELPQLFPAEQLILDAAELAVYECDALPVHKCAPRAVVLCEDEGDVVRAVRWCARHGIPFVPRGAATSLSGGATPVGEAIALDLNRLRRIVRVDPPNRLAVVEPGVVNAHLSAALAPDGFHFAPDPSSQYVCTIGGNVGENAGGPHCLKHGVTVDHVAGLTVVLPDGEVVRLGGPLAENPGYDLTGLFVGGEGTLGTITEITCRLTPAPAAVRTFLAIFAEMQPACRLVTDITRQAILPVALEIIDRRTIRAVEASVLAAGYPENAEAVVLIEIDGCPAALDEEQRVITRLVQEHGAIAFRSAHDATERLKLWKGRKSAYGAMGRVNTDIYVLDGTVPRTRLEEALAKVYEIADRRGLTISNVFHAGDGNLHPNISYDGRNAEETREVLAAGREILEACVAVGGTLSGEHGIGVEKKEFLPLVFSPDDLATQIAIRDAIDPHHLSNPGKIFPDDTGAVARTEREGSGEGETRVGEAARAAGMVGALANVATREPTAAERSFRGSDVRVLVPGTRDEACELLRAAAADGRPVVPAGEGSHAYVGNPSVETPLLVATSAFADIVEYEPDDFTIGVGAGMKLAELRETLRRNGQEIPLDFPAAAAGTVGSLMARAPSGARRARYGPLASQVLGLTAVRADGTPFRCGGMTVKNVVGYALRRFITGSLGTTGLLLRANFKLRPLPARRVLGAAAFSTPAAAWDYVASLRSARLDLAALWVLGGERSPVREPALPAVPGGRTVAWIAEGHTGEVVWLAREAERLLAGCGAEAQDSREDHAPTDFLESLAALAEPDGAAGAVPKDQGIVRLSALPSDLPELEREVLALWDGHDGLRTELAADAGTGLLTLRWRGDADTVAEPLTPLAKLACERRCAGTVLYLPPAFRARWDFSLVPFPNTELAARIVRVFDPRGTFQPERFCRSLRAASTSPSAGGAA
jgi:D-lactate dehydrogenase (cytochrome)